MTAPKKKKDYRMAERCPHLRKAGVLVNCTEKGMEICLNCPNWEDRRERCIYQTKQQFERIKQLKRTEAWYQCKCGATVTLTFLGGIMQEDSRFKQVGDKIFHVHWEEAKKISEIEI